MRPCVRKVCKMKRWPTVEDFFREINNKSTYVILRNHEGFPEKLTLDNHADIDVLCDNPFKFSDAAGSQTRGKRKGDLVHHKIVISGKEIDLDIRTVGDGYYDSKWEKNMLINRILDTNGLYYILNNEDYYYSLIYHAYIQKNTIENDYLTRLGELRKRLNKPDNCTYLEELQEFMMSEGYHFSFPSNSTVFNLTNVNKDLVEKNVIKKMHRFLWSVIHR